MELYKSWVKPILFGLDAETAHYVSAGLLQLAASFPPTRRLFEINAASAFKSGLGRNLAGLAFRNPIGLAAGFDKNAELIHALPMLGFGFAEIGTVTPRPQKGNPRPRLFRIPEQEAILNRMGFNNDGVQIIAKRLEKRKDNGFIIGGNIGKNKDTPNESAASDYLQCFGYLEDLVDYFTINVSSPNTPGLRQLLEKESLSVLLESVMNLNGKRKTPKPVFLKISPDLEEDQLEMIVQNSVHFGLSGLVATNTTINRNLLQSKKSVEALGSGGLSGRPLQATSNHIVQKLKALSPPGFVLMGSGGIMDEASALACFSAGADLVQVYSGLVYSGPFLPLKILESLRNLKQ